MLLDPLQNTFEREWTDKSDGRTLPGLVTGKLHDFMGCSILGATGVAVRSQFSDDPLPWVAFPMKLARDLDGTKLAG